MRSYQTPWMRTSREVRGPSVSEPETGLEIVPMVVVEFVVATEGFSSVEAASEVGEPIPQPTMVECECDALWDLELVLEWAWASRPDGATKAPTEGTRAIAAAAATSLFGMAIV